MSCASAHTEDGPCRPTTRTHSQRERRIALSTPLKDTISVKDEIQARNAESMVRFNAGVAAHYAPEAAVFPPNTDTLVGRSAIAAMWQGVFDMGVTRATLATEEALDAGAFAYENGFYEMFVDDNKVDWGKYMIVWKKIGAEWFLFRDMWNSSQPAG